MFTVRAKTPEVLARAMELLEITRDTVMIPKNLTGRVIGKRGDMIQDIIEKSGVHYIKVVGDDEESSTAEKKAESASATSGVPFDFISRKSAVKNAILMLNYHLDHLKDVESILKGRRGHSSDDLPLPHFSAPYRPYGRGGGRLRDRGEELRRMGDAAQMVKVGGGGGEVVPRGGGGGGGAEEGVVVGDQEERESGHLLNLIH